MRDIERIDKVLARIGAAWKMMPDMRLAQMFVDIQQNQHQDLYYKEDEDLAELFVAFVEYYTGRKVE